MDIGSRIAFLLNKHHMSQRELAEKINVTEVSVSRYTHNKRVPRTSILVAIADVFMVTIEYLLGAQEENMNKSTIKNAPNPTSSGSGEGKHDLIDRQAALDAITDELMPSTPLSAVIRAKNRLKELPSAQPEIIRCKDCKYRYLDGMIWNCPFGLSGGEDFFCAYGAIGGGSGT